VTPLRRPPVRQSVVVRSDRAHTFGIFVRTMPGGYPGGAYREGWARILGRLAATIGEQE
jgi:hypothetical protein